MRVLLVGVVLLGMTVSACAGEERIPLKVLYAGKLNDPRTEDYRAFLATHFARVGTASYVALTESDTEPYDVVILDWPDLPPRDLETRQTPMPAFSRDYARPTVLVGAGPLFLIRKFELKLRDFCVCLGDRAHGLAADHEIFRKPFPVTITLEDAPTPKSYRAGPLHRTLGASIATWKVQERGWTLESPPDSSAIPGMVAYPYGFTDSPDCEFIASGLNMKHINAVAIGRPANFLLWGFHASPRDLAPEARKCFLNAICYINKFNGERPLVRNAQPAAAREWALEYAAYGMLYADRDWVAASLPEGMRSDPRRVEEALRERMEGWRRMFPRALFGSAAEDPVKLVAYLRDRLDYVRFTGNRPVAYEIDRDAEALGVSNRSVTLLERSVSCLERGEDRERALRLLARYTNERFTEPAAWRAWLERSRDRLYFSDRGGFKFQVAPADTRALGQVGLVAAARGDHVPLEASAFFSKPLRAAGDRAEVVIRLQIDSGWHIGVLDRAGRSSLATVIALDLPRGIETEGEWLAPEPARDVAGAAVLAGSVEFRRAVRAVGVARAPAEVRCKLAFTACDAFRCRAREAITLVIHNADEGSKRP